MGDMIETIRAAKEYSKDQDKEFRQQQAKDRIHYAIDQFNKNNITARLRSSTNAHFNIYQYDKVVMSFWARTGKSICL